MRRDGRWEKRLNKKASARNLTHAQTHHPPCVSSSPDTPANGPVIPAGPEPGEGLEGPQRTTGANALFCLTAVIMLAGEKENIPGEAEAVR